MKTTLRELNELKKYNSFNLNKLTSNLGTDDLNTEVTILEILNSNGIIDALYALGTQKYKDYCLFNADVAESVLHIFEDEYPDDDRPRKAIEGIRLFHSGKITKGDLNNIDYCVYSVIDTTYHAAIHNSIFSAYNTAREAVDCVVHSSDINSRVEKWKEIEVLLRKHLKYNLLDEDLFII